MTRVKRTQAGLSCITRDLEGRTGYKGPQSKSLSKRFVPWNGEQADSQWGFADRGVLLVAAYGGRSRWNYVAPSPAERRRKCVLRNEKNGPLWAPERNDRISRP